MNNTEFERPYIMAYVALENNVVSVDIGLIYGLWIYGLNVINILTVLVLQLHFEGGESPRK